MDRPRRVSSPTMRDFLAVLFRQRTTVWVVFAVTLLGVLLYGLLAPSYRAEMKVLVRRGRVDPMVSPTPTQAPFIRPEVSEEELNSEAELLRDDGILHNVAAAAGLVPERSRLWWDSSFEARADRAVRRLGQRIKADPVRKTNIISVTYSDSDPARAARVLQCLATAYLDRHQQLRRPAGESQFFEQQIQQSRKGLERAEAQLVMFTADRGVVSASLERDLALQKLSDADASYLQTEVALAETQQRIRALENKLGAIPPTRTSQVRSSDNPQLLEKMKSRLLELELKRTELLTRFQPSYRLVQEVEQQIEETRNSIAAEAQAPVQDRTTEPDPNFDWAQGELLHARVEFTALQSRAQVSAGLLEASQRRVERLGYDAIQQEQLLRDLKTAEDKYLLYVNKKEEARVGDALDERGIVDAVIAQEPRVPALPIRSAWSLGAWGLLLSCCFSVAAGFATDYLDPALRTPDEVVWCLQAPVLASLPMDVHEKGAVS